MLALDQHTMQVYETEDALLRSILEFLVQGFQAGEAAVVIATPERRAAILHRVGRRADVLLLDAEETLASFMDGARPDGNRFHAAMRPVLAAAARAGNGRVRAYGEMVSILWSQGRREAAIGLEQLWNQLNGRPRLRLLCSYPFAGFGSPDTEKGLRVLLSEHDRVHMPESFPSAASEDELRRHVILLEQRLRFLHAQANGAEANGHAKPAVSLVRPPAPAPSALLPASNGSNGRDEAAARLEAISAALSLLACDPAMPLRRHWIATIESEFAQLKRDLQGRGEAKVAEAKAVTIEPGP